MMLCLAGIIVQNSREVCRYGLWTAQADHLFRGALGPRLISL